uniref:Uncharacterized protein n=1 Tax=Leptospira santarosai serovar Arenal str. MAVJ 401 TaxID=1049976 RepID=M6JDQ5_9LEPT|nr:hypothetical protein LEP1GSC063_2238 [Leptospira santarosai serovar Arenal str. MAVJ 401]
MWELPRFQNQNNITVCTFVLTCEPFETQEFPQITSLWRFIPLFERLFRYLIFVGVPTS